MMTEQVTESHILVPGVEVSFGLLAVAHEFGEIIVNANGEGNANHSSWRLYDTAPAGEALIWEGVLSPPFAVAQRLTPKDGIRAGGRFELRCLIDSDQPTVGPVTATLIGYDPSCCPMGDPPNPSLDQPTWYFDAVNGHDNRNGKTPMNALKTWGEWVRRIACQACDTDSDPISVLTPTGGLLSLNVLTDLPDSDPTIFRAIMGPGCTTIAMGVPKVLTSGTITAVNNKDRAINQPFTITAAALVGTWTPYIGYFVEITSGAAIGARGIVARDLGANEAHITEWCDPVVQIDGITAPSANVPSPLDTFRVLDFVQINLGSPIIGFERSKSVPFSVGGGIPIGGINWRRFHFSETSDCDVALPAILGYPEAICSFSECISNRGCQGSSTCVGILGNCSINGTTAFDGVMIITQGLSRNTDGGAAIEVRPSAHLLGQEVCAVGANVRVSGLAEFGSVSTWDAGEGVFAIPGGKIMMGEQTFYGEEGYVPYWGNGNSGIMPLFVNAFLSFTQFQFASPPALPSWEGANGPGGVIARLIAGEFAGPEAEKGYCFDRATGIFKPLGGADVKWSNLLVPFGAGGFEETVFDDGGGFVTRNAVACNPSAGSKITWSLGTFTP